MKTRTQALLAMALLWSFVNPATAAVLNMDGGRLLGASEIELNGALFDVQFVDGSCADVFGDCGAPNGAGFAFATSEEARQASNALFDQVVVPIYFYGDPVVSSIDGCTAGSLLTWLDCYVVTPFAADGGHFDAHAVFIASNPAGVISDGAFSAAVDLLGRNFVFAVWTPQDAAGVPEPGTLALLCLGLVGIGLRRQVIPGAARRSRSQRAMIPFSAS